MLHWLTRPLQSFPWFGRDPYEKLMHELDTGMFDSSLDTAAGDVAPAAPQRYADAKPFDAQAWASSRESQLNRERQSDG